MDNGALTENKNSAYSDREFNASGDGVVLEPETTYFVMIDVSQDFTDAALGWNLTRSAIQSSSHGWTIADMVLSRNCCPGTTWSSTARVGRLSIHGHVRDSVPPVFKSATVNGTALSVVFDEDLDNTSKPAGSVFTATATDPGTGVERTIVGTTATVDITSRTVTATLSEAVAYGETVTLAYAEPDANPIRDLLENELAAFSGKTVASCASRACLPSSSRSRFRET